MKKLLIAESFPLAANVLVQQFSDEWDVRICVNNIDTVEAIQQQTPDALIVSQKLSSPDACTILATCFPILPPTILIMTPSATQRDLLILSRWGVDCIFEVPCDFKQVKLTLNLLHESHSITARRAAQHLRILGILAGGNGYYSLLSSICLFRQDMTQQLHNDVYCKIAQETGVDERSIEKGIRTLIRNAWQKRDPKIWARYFPVNEHGDVACPKNKEFIMCLAQLV